MSYWTLIRSGLLRGSPLLDLVDLSLAWARATIGLEGKGTGRSGWWVASVVSPPPIPSLLQYGPGSIIGSCALAADDDYDGNVKSF